VLPLSSTMMLRLSGNTAWSGGRMPSASHPPPCCAPSLPPPPGAYCPEGQ
jgi:hypothetical protein